MTDESKIIDVLQWVGVPLKMHDLYLICRAKYGPMPELREAVWALVADEVCELTVDLKLKLYGGENEL